MRLMNYLLMMALMLIWGTLGCAKKEEAYIPPRSVAYTVLTMNSPEITTLGQLEGPYTYVSAAAPSVVVVAADNGTTYTFELVGLRNDRYPSPPPPPGQTPAVEETPLTEEEQARKQQEEQAWRDELHTFVRQGLDQICAKAKVYVLRMSDDPIAKVYLFMPTYQAGISANIPPTADAELVNALILRKGLANMELGGVTHPFQEMMLDAQLASVVESGKQADGAPPTVWSKFKIQMPPEYDSQVKDMAAKMQ